MKKLLVYAGILLSLLALIFTGCGLIDLFGSGSDDGEVTTGEIVFYNLPYGYVVSQCHVSKNPNPQWQWTSWVSTPPTIMVSRPNSDDWNPSLIGGGYMDEEFNKLVIRPGKMKVFGNHSNFEYNWEKDFTFSGQGSVWVQFHTRPDIENIRIYSMGFSNVSFKNGKATIDWSTINAYPPSLPPTNGRFTITGLDEKFNGKYVMLYGSRFNYVSTTSYEYIFGIKEASSATNYKGALISNGSVQIPLYRLTQQSLFFQAFSEYYTPFSLVVYIMDNEVIDYSNPTTAFQGATIITFTDGNMPPNNSGIQFSDGVGSISLPNDNVIILP